jgi:transketolase C-terminal domain/subunit
MVIIGDVSGLTNSRNGRTHQSSGQPGALLMMPGISFLEPWDIEDTFNCLNWAIGESRGVVFIRIHSSTIKPIEVPEGVRNITWYVVHEPPSEPDLAIVTSGLTVGQAFEAVALLEKEGVMVRIINLINHKSLDQSFAKMIPNKKPLLTVYNGNSDVLRSNVAGAMMEFGLNIPSKIYGMGFDLGTTGGTNDLLKAYGLDAAGIAQSIKTKIL